MNPSVSVIMPVYNCEAFIGEAIESILNQSFKDFELIIIDDCSTDDTLKLASIYDDQRIIIIKKNKNSGYITSLNMAIEIAKGDFIARMDGDDVCDSTRLEKQIGFLTLNKDVAVCGTWYHMILTNNIIKNPVGHDDIKVALLDYCAFGHPTIMFRGSFIRENKLFYDEGFYPAEDYELWTRISLLGKMANLPEPLLFYRSHENQVSVKDQSKQVENRYRCQTRMMCYPLVTVSDSDLRFSEEIIKCTKIENNVKLASAVDWLDKLNNANKQSGFYDDQKFKKYIADKQGMLIRTYYLHVTSYNPSVLLQFYKYGKKYRKNFNAKEQLKFIVKCLSYWK